MQTVHCTPLTISETGIIFMFDDEKQKKKYNDYVPPKSETKYYSPLMGDKFKTVYLKSNRLNIEVYDPSGLPANITDFVGHLCVATVKIRKYAFVKDGKKILGFKFILYSVRALN